MNRVLPHSRPPGLVTESWSQRDAMDQSCVRSLGHTTEGGLCWIPKVHTRPRRTLASTRD